MEIDELYQEEIIDHNENPRNFRILDNPTTFAKGYNAMCGDKVIVFLKLTKETIEEITFSGSGCAISQASASMMTEILHGKTLVDARVIVQTFLDALFSEQTSSQVDLGSLDSLIGVKNFPMRVKCATLAWRALESAILNADEAKNGSS